MNHLQSIIYAACFGLLPSVAVAGVKTCSAPIDTSASIGYPSRISVSIDEDTKNRACYFIIDGVHPGVMIQAFFDDDASAMGRALADEFEALSGGELSERYRTDGFWETVFKCYSAAFEVRNETDFLHINEEFAVGTQDYGMHCYLLANTEAPDLGEFDESLSGFGSIDYEGAEVVFLRQKQQSDDRQIIFLPILEGSE